MQVILHRAHLRSTYPSVCMGQKMVVNGFPSQPQFS